MTRTLTATALCSISRISPDEKNGYRELVMCVGKYKEHTIYAGPSLAEAIKKAFYPTEKGAQAVDTLRIQYENITADAFLKQAGDAPNFKDSTCHHVLSIK